MREGGKILSGLVPVPVLVNSFLFKCLTVVLGTWCLKGVSIKVSQNHVYIPVGVYK